jgi:pimeloyl-ACP methyl ester carboxylesterase
VADNELKHEVVAGERVAYRQWGDPDQREVVVLLHGITTYSFIWRQVAPRLLDRYRVIAPDLLGCGDSSMSPIPDVSVRGHAHSMLALLDALELAPPTRIHLVGHDIGGGAAQIMVVAQPERFVDLTLINTVAYDYWPVQPITAMRAPFIRHLMIAALDGVAFTAVVRRGLHYPERATPALMSLFRSPLRSRLGRAAFLRFAKSLDNRQLLAIADDLARLSLPTLIVRGASDRYLSARAAEQLQREIPDSRLEVCATGGHFIQEDEPDWIADRLLAFFSRGRDER